MHVRAQRPQSLKTSRRWVTTLWAALALGFCDACREPPTFSTMKIRGSPKTSYDPGESVVYDCRPGYKRTQSLPIQTVCSDDGSWSALKESCTPKACPTPAVPRNGEITNRNGPFLFGSEAHYRCFEGFRLDGKEVIYCLVFEHGVDWSDNPPLCEKVHCLPPEKIPNGAYSHSEKKLFEYNEFVTYSCNPSTTSDEFSLIGPIRRVCSADGSWSGTAPRCQVVVCPYPVVDNGTPKSTIPKKRYYNTRVIFECQQGFVLQGSDTVTCDADNKWKPALPTCIPGSTPPVSPSPSASRDHSTEPPVSPSPPASRDHSPKPPVSPSPPASRDHSFKPPVTLSTPEISIMTSAQEIYYDITSRDPSDARPSDTPPESSRSSRIILSFNKPHYKTPEFYMEIPHFLVHY